MKVPYGRRSLVLSVLLVAAVSLGIMHGFRGSAGKPAAFGVKSMAQVTSRATLGASTSGGSSITAVSGDDASSANITAPPSTTLAKPTGTAAQTSTQTTPPSNSTPPSNQSGEQNTVIHIGGYPPAVGAALTDFMNPAHVPCGGSQLQNPNCSFNSYQWEEAKYCVFTYADNHTQRQAYQYLAYGDSYANSDGTLNPSGINMAVTSAPTYTCNVDAAPKSVFEPSYTY